jgi:hypothetical protein
VKVVRRDVVSLPLSLRMLGWFGGLKLLPRAGFQAVAIHVDVAEIGFTSW